MLSLIVYLWPMFIWCKPKVAPAQSSLCPHSALSHEDEGPPSHWSLDIVHSSTLLLRPRPNTFLCRFFPPSINIHSILPFCHSAPRRSAPVPLTLSLFAHSQRNCLGTLMLSYENPFLSDHRWSMEFFNVALCVCIRALFLLGKKPDRSMNTTRKRYVHTPDQA